MRRLALGFAIFLASGLALLAGPDGFAPRRARAQDDGDAMLARVGSDMFRQYCAACHGIGGAGDGPAAPALRTPPADLTRIAARRGGAFPESDIALFIDGRFEVTAHGTREMPVWGRRFGEGIADGETSDQVVRGQILALVEYLRTIQVAAPPAP